MAIGVQESDVWAAADAVLLAGEQPTVERVRRHLGRGSPNTVGPYLKAWFRGLGERLVGSTRTDSDLPDVLLNAVTTAWRQSVDLARDEAAKEAADVRAGLEAEAAALTRARHALSQEQERLRRREVDLEAAVRAAQGQAQAAEQRLQSSEANVQELAQSLRTTQTRLHEEQGRVAALQKALTSAQDAHADAVLTLENRHATHERRWLSQIDELRQANKKSQEELVRVRKAAETEATAQQAALARVQSAQEELLRRASRAEADVQVLAVQMQAGADAARAADAHAQDKIATLAAQCETLRAQVNARDRQIELLMRPPKRRPASRTAPAR